MLSCSAKAASSRLEKRPNHGHSSPAFAQPNVPPSPGKRPGEALRDLVNQVHGATHRKWSGSRYGFIALQPGDESGSVGRHARPANALHPAQASHIAPAQTPEFSPSDCPSAPAPCAFSRLTRPGRRRPATGIHQPTGICRPRVLHGWRSPSGRARPILFQPRPPPLLRRLHALLLERRPLTGGGQSAAERREDTAFSVAGKTGPKGEPSPVWPPSSPLLRPLASASSSFAYKTAPNKIYFPGGSPDHLAGPQPWFTSHVSKAQPG